MNAIDFSKIVFTKSELFSAYNTARSAIRKLAGKSLDGKGIDVARLNRAFGILQTKSYDHFQKYGTTISSCRCPDAQKGHVCKHRIAFTVAYKIVKGRG